MRDHDAMSTTIRPILVVDDNPSIHEDFRKIFFGIAPNDAALDAAAADLFGPETGESGPRYELEFASQGQEGLEMVRTAIARQRPYAMAFVDVQMPPGWDGIETVSRIWEIAPELQIVICTAYSTYDLRDIVAKVGRSDRFVVLKKPFDSIEVLQLANAFSENWDLLNEVHERARNLEESHRRYRFLAESSPGLVWTATAGGSVDYFNQRWCDYSGLTMDQSRDWGWQSAIHPEDLPRCLENWTRALRTGENYEVEYRIKRADGLYRWHLGRAMPLRNQHGDVVQWVGTCTDIEDKKRAENDLRQANESLEKRVGERTAELTASERRYRQLINGQAEGLVYTDAELKFTFANPAAESLLGLWPGQLVGRTFLEFLDEKNKAIVVQQLKWCAAGEKSSYEVEVRTAPGERRQVLITGSPQMDSAGRFCGTFAILRDITQRKNAELALRESQHLLRAVLDNIPDPAWLKDAQGRYRVGNKPLAGIYQRRLEDIVGKTVMDVFPAHAGQLEKGDAGAAISSKPVRTEVCIPDRNGGNRWFDTIETPVLNERDELVSTVGIARDITERKEMEQALRESENRYRELLNSQDDGVVMTDADLRFVFANPAVGRILGLSADQLLGRSLAEFLDNDQKKVLGEQVELRKAGKKSSYEIEMRAVNGERRQVLVNATPKIEPDGRYCGTFAVFRDITERKRTEEKLRLQTSALLAAANGIMITDQTGVILWANPAFTELTGYSAEEIIGRTPALLKSGAHNADFYRSLWSTIISGKVWRGEMVNRRKDGSTYCEETTITPVLDERGAIKNFVAVKQDVSLRKSNEEQLRVREETFRALADNVPDAVTRLDRQLRFTYGNRAFANEIRLEPAAFLGKSAEELNLNHQEQWKKEVLRVFETGGAHRFEFSWPEPDGMCYRESRLVPERSLTGEVEFVLALTRDVSEQKRAAVERQLMDLQLRQAQKMEAIGQLAAGIAHEINTPTQYVGDNTRFLKDAFKNIAAALNGYIELIGAAKQNAVTPDLIARAEEIVRANDLEYHFEQIPAAINETLEGVERVAKIVRAMKEFSHPGGREQTTADLNKAIESTVTVARNEWKYVADLVLELDPGLPLVPCFLSEFNQAMLNLVVNAAHAIGSVSRARPTVKGRITIRTRRDGDHVEVRVSDTGTGISEEHRHRIFEPFFTTKDVGKGTGQGLTVVYSSIVKKHRGTVTFETETGKGTTFILRLPLAPKPDAAPAGAAQPPVVTAASPAVEAV
jgi:PAS domain S-box-containing protein